MSTIIAMQDIRTSIAAIARRAEKGEEFIVVRNSRPSFRIVPLDRDQKSRAPALSLKEMTDRIDRPGGVTEITPEEIDAIIAEVRQQNVR